MYSAPIHCGSLSTSLTRVTHPRAGIAPHGCPWGKALGKVIHPQEHTSQPQTPAHASVSRLTEGPLQPVRDGAPSSLSQQLALQ